MLYALIDFMNSVFYQLHSSAIRCQCRHTSSKLSIV